MGLVYAEIEIGNPRESNLETITVKSLVDMGALMLCIPEHIQIQLNLEEAEKREVTTADGKKNIWFHTSVRFRSNFKIVRALSERWFLETKCFWAQFRWKIWI